MRSVVDQFENYAKLNRKLPAETATQLSEITEAARLSDAVVANIQIKVADKQAMLMQTDPATHAPLIATLRDDAQAARDTRAAKAAATRVEFFTLQRGEDA